LCSNPIAAAAAAAAASDGGAPHWVGCTTAHAALPWPREQEGGGVGCCSATC
jgi:hypothetical protein